MFVSTGVFIQAPQLDINTVAAGGGSRLFFRSGLFIVGPESAGAHPGIYPFQHFDCGFLFASFLTINSNNNNNKRLSKI
jgi:hypothetical protein